VVCILFIKAIFGCWQKDSLTPYIIGSIRMALLVCGQCLTAGATRLGLLSD